MIYLSTGGFSSLPGADVATRFVENKITNIELSGGRAKEDQEEKLKSQILDLVNETEVKTKNTTIRKIYRTTYDYKKLTQDYGIDPSPYQKESFFWDFKQTK